MNGGTANQDDLQQFFRDFNRIVPKSLSYWSKKLYLSEIVKSLDFRPDSTLPGFFSDILLRKGRWDPKNSTKADEVDVADFISLFAKNHNIEDALASGLLLSLCKFCEAKPDPVIFGYILRLYIEQHSHIDSDVVQSIIGVLCNQRENLYRYGTVSAENVQLITLFFASAVFVHGEEVSADIASLFDDMHKLVPAMLPREYSVKIKSRKERATVKKEEESPPSARWLMRDSLSYSVPARVSVEAFEDLQMRILWGALMPLHDLEDPSRTHHDVHQILPLRSVSRFLSRYMQFEVSEAVVEARRKNAFALASLSSAVDHSSWSNSIRMNMFIDILLELFNLNSAVPLNALLFVRHDFSVAGLNFSDLIARENSVAHRVVRQIGALSGGSGTVSSILLDLLTKNEGDPFSEDFRQKYTYQCFHESDDLMNPIHPLYGWIPLEHYVRFAEGDIGKDALDILAVLEFIQTVANPAPGARRYIWKSALGVLNCELALDLLQCRDAVPRLDSIVEENFSWEGLIELGDAAVLRELAEFWMGKSLTVNKGLFANVLAGKVNYRAEVDSLLSMLKAHWSSLGQMDSRLPYAVATLSTIRNYGSNETSREAGQLIGLCLTSGFYDCILSNPYRGYFFATRLQLRYKAVSATDECLPLLFDFALSDETASPISKRSWSTCSSQFCQRDYLAFQTAFWTRAKGFTVEQVNQLEVALLEPEEPTTQIFDLSYGHRFLLPMFLRGGCLSREFKNILLALTRHQELPTADLLELSSIENWGNLHDPSALAQFCKSENLTLPMSDWIGALIEFLGAYEVSKDLFPWSALAKSKAVTNPHYILVKSLLGESSADPYMRTDSFKNKLAIALFKQRLFPSNLSANLREKLYDAGVYSLAKDIRAIPASEDIKASLWDKICEPITLPYLDFARAWSISPTDTAELYSRAVDFILSESNYSDQLYRVSVNVGFLIGYVVDTINKAIAAKVNNTGKDIRQIILENASTYGNSWEFYLEIVQRLDPKAHVLFRQISKFKPSLHRFLTQEDSLLYSIQMWTDGRSGS
jgi:hypothetical protein